MTPITSGGISPITKDFVNPERPWPHLSALAAATASRGKLLLPRLPVYPSYALDLSGRWLSDVGGKYSVGGALRKLMDSSGYVRGSEWCAGLPEHLCESAGPQQQPPPPPQLSHSGSQQQQELFMQQPVGRSFVSQHSPPSTSSSSLPSSSASSHTSISTPVPWPRAGRLWHVTMSDWGVLEGMPSVSSGSKLLRNLLDEILRSASCHTNNSTGQVTTGMTNSRVSITTAAAHNANGCSDPATTSHPPTPDQHVQLRSAFTAIPSASGLGSSTDLDLEDVMLLMSARGADMHMVVEAADALRQTMCGNTVTYVVNRNINYTNVCTYGCQFCAFSKVGHKAV